MKAFYLEQPLVDNLKLLKEEKSEPLMHLTSNAIMAVLLNQV